MKLFHKMKKILSLAIAFILFSMSVFAAEGDTITVRVHDRTHMNYYGSFDKKALFPKGDVSFRKAWLYFTIGCPDNGCSPWDYTTKIFVRRGTGKLDTAGKEIKEDIEISRYITPYATGLTKTFARLFRMDVTDYLPLLTDSVEIRLFYEGYSDGFTVTTDFQLIKGTPTRKTIGIENVYSGYFDYGNSNNPIEDKLILKKYKAPAGAKSVRLRTLQTGHGGEQNQNCAEFCSKTATIKINESYLFQNVIWRDNCGLNAIFPQPGTWIYDRANWCPGATVTPFYNELTPIINLADSFSVDMDMDEFTANGSAGYNIATQLIYYDNAAYKNDIELEDIIAPSKTFEYNRMNPVCGQPKIRVRNCSASPLTSMVITYGLTGGQSKIINWEGSIEPYAFQDIDLEPIAINNNEKTFYCSLSNPNGSADDNMVNNELITTFNPAVTYPSKLVFELRTNARPTQSIYTLTNSADSTIVKRAGAKSSTNYRDTVTLADGCYTLRLIDKNKDGLSFSFNSDGNGYLIIKSIEGKLLKSFEPNFGTEISQQFIVGSGTSNVEELKTEQQKIFLFPNPTANSFTLLFGTMQAAVIQVYDYTGKMVLTQSVVNPTSDEVTIDASSLHAGMYLVSIITANGSTHKKLIKE